jgi:diamine N-acetyltransferase
MPPPGWAPPWARQGFPGARGGAAAQDRAAAWAAAWQHRSMDTPVLLRDATPDDALLIGVLGTQVSLDTYATAGISPLLAREVREHFNTEPIAALLARRDTRFVLAERQANLVGFVQLAFGARHALVAAERAVEIDRLYVQAPFKGQGIGKALVAAAAERARGRGGTSPVCCAAERARAWCAQALWLTAWVGNEAALAWYRRQGWRELGSTDYVFENERFENRVFERALPPA